LQDLCKRETVAKGEVVFIDENFAIKITDIINPNARANTLQ
jgi:hypothetical protein